MHVEHLELVDYRSYRHLKLQLEPGVVVLVGANAQGKTNLLEALHYLAVGASHRVASDAPLVRVGAETAVIRAGASLDNGSQQPPRRLTVEVELRPGGRGRARVNGQPQPRLRDAVGQIRSVLFAPEDLALVRGEPADRRRFLDDLLGQRRPAYRVARAEYERVLRQRNTLLRLARRTNSGPGPTLETWTEALVHAGATLLAARIAVVHALAGSVASAYAELVADSTDGGQKAGATLTYRLSTGRCVPATPGEGVPDPASLAVELRAGLDEAATEERDRGVSLAGPHRDDLVLAVGEFPAKGYASHGEAWSLALALRLASREVLREVGEEPVVLLDDVFAELDESRRDRLATRCTSFEQVLVTAAVDADVPLDGPRYEVLAGTVTRQVPGSSAEAGHG